MRLKCWTFPARWGMVSVGCAELLDSEKEGRMNQSITVLYCCLSQDDSLDRDPNSILQNGTAFQGYYLEGWKT